jgi:hypothetical protein
MEVNSAAIPNASGEKRRETTGMARMEIPWETVLALASFTTFEAKPPLLLLINLLSLQNVA